MKKFDLCSPPSQIKINNKDTYDKSCSISISEEAIKRLKENKLNISITKNNKDILSNISIKISSLKGSISIILHKSNVDINFGNNSSGRFNLAMFGNSRVFIGNKTTSNGVHIVCMNSEFICGEDCMFSDGVLIQTTDQHGIVDLTDGEIINKDYNTIKLGDHVWLGRGCSLTSSAAIGSGSIVGLKSVVTKSFPENSVVGGNPAKVLKTNHTWSRSTMVLDNYSSNLTKNIPDFR